MKLFLAGWSSGFAAALASSVLAVNPPNCAVIDQACLEQGQRQGSYPLIVLYDSDAESPTSSIGRIDANDLIRVNPLNLGINTLFHTGIFSTSGSLSGCCTSKLLQR